MSSSTFPPAAAAADRPTRPLAGIAWMVVASVLFAVMNLSTRLAARQVPWLEVAAARAVVGAVVALLVAVGRGASLRIRDRRKAWIRSLCGTIAMLCTFYTLGAPTIALGDAVTLGATTAIFLAILSPWLLGEASTGRVWVPTLIAFGGVALVVGPQFEIAGQTGLVAVAGSFFSALAMVMLRKLGGAKGGLRESPEAIVVHFSLVATVVLCALAAPAWRTPGASGAALLAVTGITGGLAQLAMTRAYALDHAARIGTIAYVAVVLSHLLGILVLHERPAPEQALGAVLVIGAGVALAYFTLRDARRNAAERASI